MKKIIVLVCFIIISGTTGLFMAVGSCDQIGNIHTTESHDLDGAITITTAAEDPNDPNYFSPTPVDMEEFKQSCESFHRAYQTIKDAQFGIIDKEPNIVFTDTTATIDFVGIYCRELATYADISFSGREGSEVLFNWRDGKFDVTYDANECTQSAQTFIDCMLPFLNETIKTAAKELIEKEKKNGR